jgi:hypothetical protein
MATFAKSAGLYLVKKKLTTLAGHFRFAIHRGKYAVGFYAGGLRADHGQKRD